MLLNIRNIREKTSIPYFYTDKTFREIPGKVQTYFESIKVRKFSKALF